MHGVRGTAPPQVSAEWRARGTVLRRRVQSRRKLCFMDPAVAGLLGAAIGALSGLCTSLVTGWHQRQLERRRWQQSRSDELGKEERRALLELTTLLAEGSQNAAWLAWAAGAKPMHALQDEASDYELRMRLLLPKLFSAEAAASGLSDTAFAEIDPLVQRLVALDTRIGGICALIQEDPMGAVQQLRNLQGAAFELTRDIVLTVRSSLRVEDAIRAMSAITDRSAGSGA